MKTKQRRLTQEGLRLCAVLVLGVAMYGAAIGLEKVPVWQELRAQSYAKIKVDLGTKKTCIVLAWHEQAENTDRARCAQYLKQRSPNRQVLADNRLGN